MGKKVLAFLLLIWQSFTAFSQFSDNFSDGRFLSGADSDRVVDWIGDNAEFIVNPSLQLQLYADGNHSPSQLKTQSTLVGNTSWEFYLKMDFVPTASNYAKIYIASNEENLAGELDGLFIRVGYTDKNICLISSQKGKNNRTLIQGTVKRLDFSSVALNVKATLDSKGNFKLYSRLEGESDFSLEGSCLLTDIPVSNWFGIVCVYTTTRSKLFYFDDFVVDKLSDEEPGEEPEPDDELPREGDILFSEIMANPLSGNPEYIELYNTTDKTFRLKDCLYYYGDKSYKLPDEIIEPLSYFVLCKTTTTNQFESSVPAWGVTSFPTLANTGKLLMFGNTAGELISWFEYSDKMYNDNEKKSGGWALECIDLTNRSNTSANWSASVHPSGGTPGKENSIKANHPDTDFPEITSSYTDENNSLIVNFSKPMNRKTLTDANAYTIHHPDYQIIDLQTNYPQGNELIIQLNAFPPSGNFFEIEINGIEDLSGNTLLDNILVGYGYEAEPNDIIINELLFNAPSGGNEYVELYNCSDKVLDLRYLSITSRKPSDGSFNRLYPLTSLPLFLYPQEYLVVTKSRELVCEYFNCQPETFWTELPAMPSIANASGCVVILNNQNDEIIDELPYNEKMHSPGIKDKKGVALERIHFESPTDEASNWQSATAQSGYGTPGYANSQQASGNGNALENTVYVEYPAIDINEYRIKYQLNKSGYQCKIYIYDSSGRKIDSLLNGELIGTEGEIPWSGKGNRDQRLTAGIYVVYVELFDTNGEVHKIKLPVVLK